MKRHIFGMAKSSLDLRGAKGRNLELDFLRLVYAVQHYRRLGDEAQGYLAACSKEAESRITAWAKKYDAEAVVTCIPAWHDVGLLKCLHHEKSKNVEGMI